MSPSTTVAMSKSPSQAPNQNPTAPNDISIPTPSEIARIRRETVDKIGKLVPEMIHTIKNMPTQELLQLHKRWTFNHDPVLEDGIELDKDAMALLALGPQHIPVPRHPPIYEFNVKIQSFINWVRGRKSYGYQPDTRKFREPTKQPKFTEPLIQHPEIELFIKLVLQDLYNVQLYNKRPGQPPYNKWLWYTIFGLRYNSKLCITKQDKGGKG